MAVHLHEQVKDPCDGRDRVDMRNVCEHVCVHVLRTKTCSSYQLPPLYPAGVCACVYPIGEVNDSFLCSYSN